MNPADVARELAAALRGWTLAPLRFEGQHFAELRRVDGARVAVHVGGWVPKGRVVFAGQWPRFADGSPYLPSLSAKDHRITCAVGRTPAQFAKEITRRLLPAYDLEYSVAKAYVDRHDANASDAGSVAARLAASLGDGAKLGENKARRGDGVTVWCDSIDAVRRLRVDPAYGDRPMGVSFEVHDLAPETALAVLRTIQASEERSRCAPVRVRAATPEVEEKDELTHLEAAQADVEASKTSRKTRVEYLPE